MKYLLSCCSFIALALTACGSGEPATTAQWEHSITGLYAAAVSSNGRYAVVSSSSDGASYWDLGENARLYDWRHNDAGEDPISHVAFAPDDSHVITADSLSFVIWNAQTGHALGYWSVEAPINSVALSNNARFVLLGLTDGRALHIDRNSGRRLEVIAHQGERVSSVALSSDGALAATGGNDGRVMVWDTRSGAERHVFEHDARIAIVTFDTHAKQLFSADERGHATVRDLATGETRATLALMKFQQVITAARFSADGSQLLAGFPGRDVRLWNTSDGRLIAAWRAPSRRNGWIPQGSTVYAVAFNDSANTIVAESSNGLGGAWRAAVN